MSIQKHKKLCIIGNFVQGPGISPQTCTQYVERFNQQEYQVFHASDAANKPLRLFKMLWTLISKRNRYEIVSIDTFSGPAFLFAQTCGRLCRYLNKPYVPILHGGQLPDFYKTKNKAIKQYLDQASAIVSPSPFLKRWAEKISKETLIIPNPVDLEGFQFLDRLANKEKLEPKLFWLRRFHPLYRPRQAIEVLKLVSQSYPRAKLFMAGEDSGELEPCQELAQKYGLEEKIEFKGLLNHAEVEQYSRNYDIFLNTSSADNTPRSLVEAAALGMAIVTSNVGGIPDLFEDQKEALLCPLDDPLSMSKSIHRLIEQPDFSRQMIRNARQKVERFSWPEVLQQWETLFKTLV